MRYSILTILAFIGLLIWARYDYMDRKGHWQPTDTCNNPVPFVVKTKEGHLAKVENGLCYSLHSVAPQLSSEAQRAIDSLANFLKIQNDKMLLIQGSHQDLESKSKIGGLSSLGEARAKWLATSLNQIGISRSRFILKDTVISNNIPNFITAQITTELH